MDATEAIVVEYVGRGMGVVPHPAVTAGKAHSGSVSLEVFGRQLVARK